MKKIFSFMLALAMVLSMTACGGNTQASVGGGNNSDSSVSGEEESNVEEPDVEESNADDEGASVQGENLSEP